MPRTPRPAFGDRTPEAYGKSPSVGGTPEFSQSMQEMRLSISSPVRPRELTQTTTKESIEIKIKLLLLVPQQTLMTKTPTLQSTLLDLTTGRRNRPPRVGRIPRTYLDDSRPSRETKLSDASSSSKDGSARTGLPQGQLNNGELVPIGGSLTRHSILVINALDNDEWSFYAAGTYPAATFFNPSPRFPLPEELENSIQLYNFTFGAQSFTAVVYHFLVASPGAYYRSILTEAGRVLKSGGYIKLSILDKDLNNMGNQGQRTVCHLKGRIQEMTSDTSLGSNADLIIRLLGKVGFTTIKAVRVGVPVASSVIGKDSKADDGNDAAEKEKDPPSLSEMMSDNSPLMDDNITKIVSGVGRWWYTRCYENVAGNPSGKSIRSDKLSLRNGELGTSLKLMLCSARAPLERITGV
ncbi:uncharacterized protein FMAN_14142 [Fusarium mangiferae]|uniref:Methyltransferase type 11 domain-containing protein n=1 Tax=Fusarium mangiferae TaxID=192010 RepID=A0A1L7UBX9_FUSMA|nr:uncharacterized protein FMAN_14142 [Fusarium mangiferae]CVL08234.1 uncharacterized protein FMAN_14142 [Fusarium mangiferae]